jgi:hypothetical protein
MYGAQNLRLRNREQSILDFPGDDGSITVRLWLVQCNNCGNVSNFDRSVLDGRVFVSSRFFHRIRNDRASTLCARATPTYFRPAVGQGPLHVQCLLPDFLHYFQASVFCFAMIKLLNDVSSVGIISKQ